MKLSEPFHMDGRSYRQAELISFCREALQDPGIPDWKQHVYSFVALFLDPSEGEISQKSSGTTGDPREHQLHREKMVTQDGCLVCPGITTDNYDDRCVLYPYLSHGRTRHLGHSELFNTSQFN